MDRVEYAFAVTALTGFLVLIAGMAWLMMG